jgi:DNA-binding NarL/FixJ family response regulator
MIRVAIADDHPVVLTGLTQLFAGEPDFAVVAACTGGRDLMAFLERGGVADVIVLDLRMRELDGMGVLRRLKTVEGGPAILLLTGAAEKSEEREAARLGARAVVRKEEASSDLLAAVRAVAAGQNLCVGQPAQADESGLSAREVEIVQMVAAGLRNKQIAFRCAISEGTVKLHLHNIYRKLGIDGRMALSIYARATGLAP